MDILWAGAAVRMNQKRKRGSYKPLEILPMFTGGSHSFLPPPPALELTTGHWVPILSILEGPGEGTGREGERETFAYGW